MCFPGKGPLHVKDTTKGIQSCIDGCLHTCTTFTLREDDDEVDTKASWLGCLCMNLFIRVSIIDIITGLKLSLRQKGEIAQISWNVDIPRLRGCGHSLITERWLPLDYKGLCSSFQTAPISDVATRQLMGASSVASSFTCKIGLEVTNPLLLGKLRRETRLLPLNTS